jgi:hypothetical protein
LGNEWAGRSVLPSTCMRSTSRSKSQKLERLPAEDRKLKKPFGVCGGSYKSLRQIHAAGSAITLQQVHDVTAKAGFVGESGQPQLSEDFSGANTLLIHTYFVHDARRLAVKLRLRAMMTLQSIREIRGYRSPQCNGTIAVILQQFRYFNTECGIVEQQTADVG